MARRGLALILSLLGAALVISFVGFLLMYFLFGREPSVPEHAVLRLRVSGQLAEVAPSDVVSYFRGIRQLTVRAVVDDLRKAAVDPRIGAVLLEPSGFDSPFWGKVEEIREAVIAFRKSGKPIYAYVESGGDQDYYLASAADKVYLMPSTPLDLVGIATYELFLRGTLDWIGAYPDLHHIGEYKTAINTFTEKGYTAAQKEMDESLDRDLYAQVVRGIADARGKTEAQVRDAIDQGPFLPEDALKAGLIDDVAYEDQVFDRLRSARPSLSRSQIDGDDYSQVGLGSVGLGGGPRIAVIYAAGTITSGRSGFDPVNGAILGSDTLIDYIRDARRDRSIRAIVLRVDSPGGSAIASDAIWRELMIARNERGDRPLVVSMSDLAASGGYYIALPAQYIVAQPATLTGSIGIFGGKVVTGGAYEKLGANVQSTSIGRNAEIDSPVRPYTPEELKKLQEQLQAFYDQFVEKVAASRHTTPEKIDEVAQGRVWTGRQAKDVGLVDELGGLQDAVAAAKQRARIPAAESVTLVVYPPRRSLYELLSDEFSGGGDRMAANRWLEASLSKSEMQALRVLRGPLSLFRRGELLAMMPFQYLR